MIAFRCSRIMINCREIKIIIQFDFFRAVLIDFSAAQQAAYNILELYRVDMMNMLA